jgi:hypothetical protein
VFTVGANESGNQGEKIRPRLFVVNKSIHMGETIRKVAAVENNRNLRFDPLHFSG